MAEHPLNEMPAVDDGAPKPEPYEVGYKRPPKATQFKPGQSGNCKGRPKGSLNFSTVLDKELNSLVPVTENGRRKQVRKRDLIGKQLVNKAASGDLKATSLLMNEVRAREGESMVAATASPEATPGLFAREDQMTMNGILARLRQTLSDNPSGTPETRTNAGADAAGDETSEGEGA